MKRTTPQQQVEHSLVTKSFLLYYLIPPCLLALLTILFYMPSLHYEFQFDDIANITKHFDIRHNTFSALFFTGTRWISYWLNAIHYSIGNFDPFSYRVGNLIIHLINGLFLFFIFMLGLSNLKKISFFRTNAYPLALMTSILFLLHPVHTQTVSYVIQGQLEGLSTLFILAMILCFLAYTRAVNFAHRLTFLTLLFSSAVLSCGTKEIAIISPVLLLLVDWFFIAQGNWQDLKKRWLIHTLLAGTIIGIYLYFLKPAFFTEIIGLKKIVRNNIGNVITNNPEEVITSWSFFISQFKVILHYLWIFVWPFNISVEYDWILSKGILAADSFFPLLFLLGIGFTIMRLLKANSTSPIGFGALWFFLCILPRSSIIPSPELLVDYKTYMASIGWLFILACTIIICMQLLTKNSIKLYIQKLTPIHATAACVIFLALPLGYFTMQRNTIWRSGIEFWDNMIKNAPGKARAYNNYGVELSQHLHKFQEAVPYFKKAIEMDAKYPDPWNNLAVAYSNLGQVDNAIEALKECIKLNPYYPEGYNNLASFYIQKNDLDKAERLLQTALTLRPYYGKAKFNQGRIHLARNEHEKAWECIKDACTKGDFDIDHGFASYGQISFNLKKYDDAIKGFERALQLNPKYPGAAFNLANAYFFTQQYEKALSVYKQIVAQDPQAHQTIFNLGETYFTMQNYQEALTWFKKLDTIKLQMPQVYIRSAQCLEKMGDVHGARTIVAELIDCKNQTNDPVLTQVKQTGQAFLAHLNNRLSQEKTGSSASPKQITA